MSLTRNQALKVERVPAATQPGVNVTAAEGGGVALVLGAEGPSTQWTYSATAESLGGEVAVNGWDFDAEPGLIYGGPVGASAKVNWSNIDVAGVAGGLPEANDAYAIGLFRNNTLIAESDEGFAVEYDSETVEYNGEGVITNLQTNDVLRFALLTESGSEDGLALNVTEAGEIVIF